MQVERQPVADEDHTERRQLQPLLAPQEQISEKVAESNLREHIGEDPVRPVRIERVQKNPHQHEDLGPPDGVAEAACSRMTGRFTPRIGERHRDADHKHERRLNQVPERHAELEEPARLVTRVVSFLQERRQEIALPVGVVEMEPDPLPVLPIVLVPDRAFGIDPGELRDAEAARRQNEHDEAAIGVERDQPLRRGGLGFRAVGHELAFA